MMEGKEIITINSRKYGGELHKSWEATFLGKHGSQLLFVGEFMDEVSHPFLGIIRRGTISFEYYWLDRWYNVFRFHDPDGKLRNFYCNVNMLPNFENGFLDYIDLDVDILVWKDFSYQILDMNEFEENAQIFSYPDYLREKVCSSLSELTFLIENKTFPFDYKF